jgi:glycosyltransferase involved in cell wall biosynthesis
MPTRTDPSPSIGLATQQRDEDAREIGTYIVVVSPSYGGAEKRFFDIFRAMRQQGADVQLIAPSSLTVRLLEGRPNEPDLAAAVIPVPLERWKPFEFVARYRQLLRTLPRGSNFHYPMNCLWPLHIGRGDKVTMSVTNCVQPPGASLADRTRFWSWLSFFFVRRIDVLSPAILSGMAGYRTASKMSLTPGGTFIESMPPPATQIREPTAVLLTRLVPGKGLDDFLDVLPDAWQQLQHRVPADFTFRVAGYGPLQDHVVARISALAAVGIPIEFIGYADASILLPTVSIALSMQEATNYPSRVVAEALVAGCSVIIRDTGDTRQFGQLPGLRYCGEILTAEEFADNIVSELGEIASDPEYCASIQKAALERFGAKASVDYFIQILKTD